MYSNLGNYFQNSGCALIFERGIKLPSTSSREPNVCNLTFVRSSRCRLMAPCYSTSPCAAGIRDYRSSMHVPQGLLFLCGLQRTLLAVQVKWHANTRNCTEYCLRGEHGIEVTTLARGRGPTAIFTRIVASSSMAS